MNGYMVNDTTVAVHRVLPRTKRGMVRKSTRDALIRAARKIAPEFSNAAVTELHYGVALTDYNDVTFDPTRPASEGF